MAKMSRRQFMKLAGGCGAGVAGAFFAGCAGSQAVGGAPGLASAAGGGPGGDADRALSLSGSGWWLHDDPDGKGADRGLAEADPSGPDWVPAAVPGNVQSDLEAAHRLRPIWYGAGDERLHDVAKKDWWYRRDFTVLESFRGKHLTLVFDGVDHECEVWLNGRKVGDNAGMFRRFWFDVTDLAEPGKVSRLAVRITRIPEAIAPLVVLTDGKGVGGGETHFLRGVHLTATTLKDLKSPTNWGWDWGVNIWTLGIWKGVRLEATGPARIDWVRVQTALSEDHTKATVTVTLEIDSKADLPARTLFRIDRAGRLANAAVPAPLKKGRNVVKAEIALDRPELWWPNGHGAQPLYGLSVELQPAEAGAALDERRTRFGVRDIRWVHTEGAPADFVSRYQLIVNGRPVRTIGSNLIPPDLLFGRMAERTLSLLRRAKEAGVNTLRLWGGGVILHDEAYDLADELGIMLVQELPLANTNPDKDDVFLENLESTVRNIFRQVRNHPSIIEFDGGNEMPWNSLTIHPALQLLQRIAAEEDGRMFRATCPDTGAKHGPWDFDLHKACPLYDERSTMRYGEFGSASPANLEVWHRTIPPKSQWPVIGTEEPIQIRKNIVQAVFAADFWLRKGFVEAVFGPLVSLEEMVRAGQFYGAEGLRYAIDALRRKGRHIGGLTTWDFNEPWPNGAGSYLVDHDGRPLMNYDFFRQALATISLSLKYDSILYDPAAGIDFEVWIASDAPEAARGLKWRLLARDRRGKKFADEQGTADIEPIEARKLRAVHLTPPKPTALGPVFVEMQLFDSAGRLLVERIHVFGAKSMQGPLGGLLRSRRPDREDDVSAAKDQAGRAMPVTPTSLNVTAKPARTEAGQEILDLVVTNNGPMTSLFCEPHPLIEYRTDLFIDNNHCFIPPGQSRTITIRATGRPDELSLIQTGWRITAFNADDKVIEPGGGLLLALGRRDAMCREFAGYDDPGRLGSPAGVVLDGARPEANRVPWQLKGEATVRLRFEVEYGAASGGATLRLHTADQSAVRAEVAVTLNGHKSVLTLPKGLGIQDSDPAHLAMPATARIDLPAGTLKAGANELEVRVSNDGWFTWDAMDLTAR